MSDLTKLLKSALEFDEPKDCIPLEINAARRENARLRPLHEALVECIVALEGCSDGNCRILGPRGGQHTNGGCRCRDNIKYTLNKLKEVLK